MRIIKACSGNSLKLSWSGQRTHIGDLWESITIPYVHLIFSTHLWNQHYSFSIPQGRGGWKLFIILYMNARLEFGLYSVIRRKRLKNPGQKCEMAVGGEVQLAWPQDSRKEVIKPHGSRHWRSFTTQLNSTTISWRLTFWKILDQVPAFLIWNVTLLLNSLVNN